LQAAGSGIWSSRCGRTAPTGAVDNFSGRIAARAQHHDTFEKWLRRGSKSFIRRLRTFFLRLCKTLVNQIMAACAGTTIVSFCGMMQSFGFTTVSVMDFTGFGKILLIVGLILAGLGALFMLGPKGPLSWMGRLPGDLYFRGGRFSFYFPLATGLLISIVLSLILWFINRR
jgi:hypothetical protein